MIKYFIVAATLAMPAAAQTFEAANGAKFRIDLVEKLSPDVPQDKRRAVGIIDEDGHAMSVMLDCVGGYTNIPAGRFEGWQHIPPRSMLAAISRNACAR